MSTDNGKPNTVEEALERPAAGHPRNVASPRMNTRGAGRPFPMRAKTIVHRRNERVRVTAAQLRASAAKVQALEETVRSLRVALASAVPIAGVIGFLLGRASARAT